ncbi:MAG TPA: MGMT family protein [bacterium]|nr:MGMT family protein [bacterium]
MKDSMVEGFIHFFNTVYGSVAIVWKNRNGVVKVKEIMISNSQFSAEQRVAVKYPDASLKSCTKVSQLTENIVKYCNGENVEFKLDLLDLEEIPQFRKKVYNTLFKTKRGETLSYGELAYRSGYPGAARAVGTAMKNNPFPFIIPCHRVIRSDGSLGGFFGAEEMKKKLIEKEKQ